MKPWECPRCGTINAPWTSSCTCRPKTPPLPPLPAPDGAHVPPAKPRATVLEDVEGDPPDAWDQAPTKVATDSAVKRLENVKPRPNPRLAPRAVWDGLCNAKKHPVGSPNEVCDLCAKERKTK